MYLTKKAVIRLCEDFGFALGHVQQITPIINDVAMYTTVSHSIQDGKKKEIRRVTVGGKTFDAVCIEDAVVTIHTVPEQIMGAVINTKQVSVDVLHTDIMSLYYCDDNNTWVRVIAYSGEDYCTISYEDDMLDIVSRDKKWFVDRKSCVIPPEVV